MMDKFLDLDLDKMKATAQDKLMGSIQNKLEAANIGQVLDSLKENPTTAKILDPFFAALNKVGADICSVTGTCPFSKPEISIVPVRYAIDEQLSDSTTSASENNSPPANGKKPPKLPGAPSTPKGKHPLPSNGPWQPPFHTGVRQPQLSVQAPYTLRQLRDGWLYVYSEQDDTLHEYKVAGTSFIKIEWSDSDAGKDERGTEGSVAGYLSYPSNQVLQLAFAHQRWTWRLCEHMRSNHDSRTSWMRKLSLPDVAASKKVMHSADIAQLGILTADINAAASTRFSHTCTPLFQADIVEEQDNAQPPRAKKQASTIKLIAAKPSSDVDAYTKHIFDLDSAIMVALDDPLADLCDLYQLLAPEWAEHHQMQADHKLQMATVTEPLALPHIDEDQLPEHLHNDMRQRIKLKRDIMKVVESNKLLSDSLRWSGQPDIMPPFGPLKEKIDALKAQGFTFKPRQLEDWVAFCRYQDEIDWQSMDSYLQSHETKWNKIQKAITRCHQDLRNACEQIGSNPILLGLDNQQVQGQDYLQTLFVELLPMLKQTALTKNSNEDLAKLFHSATPNNLLTLAPYCFDAGVYQAMTAETLDNKNINQLDVSNIQAWVTRLSEWDTIRSDSGSRDSVWYRTLLAPVRFVLNAASEIGIEKIIKIQGVIDSTLENRGLLTGLRTLLMFSTLHSDLQLKHNNNYQSELAKFEKDKYLIEKKLEDLLKEFKLNGGDKTTLKNSHSALVSELDDLNINKVPALIKFNNAGIDNATKRALKKHIYNARESIRSGIIYTQDNINTVAPNLTSVGGALTLLNMWNLTLTITQYPELEKSYGTGYALREVGISFSWTVNAYSSLYQASVWSDITKNNKLLKTSLTKALMENKKLVVLFVKSMATMATFGLIASSLEAWHSFTKASSSNSELSDEERYLYNIKGYLNGGLSLIYFSQLLLLIARVSFGVIFAPWMLIAIAAIGIASLIIDVIINVFKKNNIEKWLVKSTWGIDKAGWSIDTELNKLDYELNKPQASITETINPKTGKNTHQYRLELRLPLYLFDKNIGLEITTATDMPAGAGALDNKTIELIKENYKLISQKIEHGIININTTHIDYHLTLRDFRVGHYTTRTKVLLSYPKQYGGETRSLSLQGVNTADFSVDNIDNPKRIKMINFAIEGF